jgi:hypothetical protein
MTKKELLCMTKKGIAEIAKEKGIARYKGKSMLTKDELIDKILVFEDIDADIKKSIEESGKIENVEDNSSRKQHYIDSVEVGVLVAFHNSEKDGKMDTAKVINKSTKSKKLMLETQYGKQYIISFDDVAWVKTGTRWPRGIYRELKGLPTDEK